MTDILKKICKTKKQSLIKRKSEKSIEDLIRTAKKITTAPRFIQSIKNNTERSKPSLISEIKKASPSHGLIKKNFNPIEIENAYRKAGATCISILTEEDYFQGNDQYLKDVHNQSPLPILRKDFTVDEYQIYESKILGADCILLIVAALSDDELKHLYKTACTMNIDTLIEVHNEIELERALKLNPQMIGINNRNLKTLEIDLQTSFALKKKIPDSIISVTESGIQNYEQLSALYSAGFDAFLVGESLMKQDDIETATRKLLTGS